jgi:hypothetical protein
MNFHLNYTPAPSKDKITHQDKILMSGSCFSEEIGSRLRERKFNCLLNPGGILFNPISLAKNLNSYLQNKKLGTESIVRSLDLFYSLDHHGDLSALSDPELRQLIDTTTVKAHQFLKSGNWLVVTFGSAFVYRYKATGKIVANCHKLAPDEFTKELLKSSLIVEVYNRLIKDLQAFVPELKIMFTVSPVKYLRDGLIENSRSKSVLIQSVHEIIEQNSNCYYFPAYELVNDDLRDYRFYKEDLAHPNEQAVNYVWEKFSNTYFSEETLLLNKKTEDILIASKHRPIKENSLAHTEFKETFLKKCNDLEKEFPFLDFEEEKLIFS